MWLNFCDFGMVYQFISWLSKMTQSVSKNKILLQSVMTWLSSEKHAQAQITIKATFTIHTFQRSRNVSGHLLFLFNLGFSLGENRAVPLEKRWLLWVRNWL